MTQEGQWCKTVGELLNYLKNVDRNAAISMADGADIYVVPEGGMIVFTDLDDDGNGMAAEESDLADEE